MDIESVKAYFNSAEVVDDYAEAAVNVGLWDSEEKVFTRLFRPEDSLLELGCGAGRIALGLYELGYRNLLATDYSKAMIRRARDLTVRLEYRIPFRVCDATDLEFEDNIFDGVIFGFNGLMQIPGSGQRDQALSEIYRVLRPGAWFTFTSHDRTLSPHQDFWSAENLRWSGEMKKPGLHEFGDRVEVSSEGIYFIHIPCMEEVQLSLEKVGFQTEATAMRSELAQEPPEVEAFSDDCRFWVVRKPESSG